MFVKHILNCTSSSHKPKGKVPPKSPLMRPSFWYVQKIYFSEHILINSIKTRRHFSFSLCKPRFKMCLTNIRSFNLIFVELIEVWQIFSYSPTARNKICLFFQSMMIDRIVTSILFEKKILDISDIWADFCAS